MVVGLAFDFADALFADGNPILDEVVGMQNSFAVTSFRSHNMTFTNRMTSFSSFPSTTYATPLCFPSQILQQMFSIKQKVHRAMNMCSLHGSNKVTINVDNIDCLTWSYRAGGTVGWGQ